MKPGDPGRFDSLATSLKSCCVATYSHPLTRWLLGESLHPGGLALTGRLARAAGIGPQSLVLDVGSGLGASSVHLAATTRCGVTGLTLEEDGVAYGRQLAMEKGVGDRVTFVQSDIHDVELPPRSFDVAMMECVLSIIADKPAALWRVHNLLRPDGRLAFSDVTCDGQLPEDLRGLAASVACLGSALSLDGYRALLESAGFAVERCEDLPEAALDMLRDIKGKLMIAEVAMKLGKWPDSSELLATVKGYLSVIENLVRQGVLSYGMIVARL